MPEYEIKNDLDLQPYINMLVEFLNSNKFGSVTYFIQNGKITGVDVTEKQRNDTSKQYKAD